MRTTTVRIRSGEDAKRDVAFPSFIALNCHRERDVLRFERLNVDELLPSGEEEAVFITSPDPRIPPERILIRWPGLHIGLYEANGLRILGVQHVQS